MPLKTLTNYKQTICSEDNAKLNLHSHFEECAWRWVSYLLSPECFVYLMHNSNLSGCLDTMYYSTSWP